MLLEGHLIRFCESWRQAHFGSVSKHREKIPRPHRTKRLILCFQQSWRIHKITIHSRKNSEKKSQKFREKHLKNFGEEEFTRSLSTIGQKFVNTLSLSQTHFVVIVYVFLKNLYKCWRTLISVVNYVNFIQISFNVSIAYSGFYLIKNFHCVISKCYKKIHSLNRFVHRSSLISHVLTQFLADIPYTKFAGKEIKQKF